MRFFLTGILLLENLLGFLRFGSASLAQVLSRTNDEVLNSRMSYRASATEIAPAGPAAG
jgi:hypothetical protein